MNFKTPQLLGHTPPILEIPTHQVWHRVQRKNGRGDSVRLKGYVLAPPGGLAGRFDLADEATAYVADSTETALYESLFRREVRSCHLSRIEQRALVSFETVAPVRLVDLRGLEERYPVLQSMRYETSQAFAQACRQQGLHGILYASAQHASHSCVCLFKAGIERTKKLQAAALVQPGTGHRAAAQSRGAGGARVAGTHIAGLRLFLSLVTTQVIRWHLACATERLLAAFAGRLDQADEATSDGLHTAGQHVVEVKQAGARLSRRAQMPGFGSGKCLNTVCR